MGAWTKGINSPAANLSEMLSKAFMPTLLPIMRNAWSPYLGSVSTGITEMMKVHLDTTMHQAAIGESYRSLYASAMPEDLFKFPMTGISEMVSAPWRNAISAADFGNSISKIMSISIPKVSVSAIHTDIWKPIEDSIDDPFIDQLLANQEALNEEIDVLEVEQLANYFF